MIDTNTKLLIQGITGKEGQRAVSFMQSYGTNIVAGVTPGKGGQEVSGIPVYNSVREALTKHPEINASSIYVPPRFVKSAFTELAQALSSLHTNTTTNSQSPFIVHIIAEGVPIHDTAYMLELSTKLTNTQIIGPSSIGIIRPGASKIGSIGGNLNDSFLKGNIAVLSKSGGLASEVSLILKTEGFGQSLVVGIGGDILIGSAFHDFFEFLENDPQTEAVVLIGEVGGTYEQQAAHAIEQGKLTKPVVAFVSGLFTETMPQGTAIGHAGAIIEGRDSTRTAKIQALKHANVHIAETLTQIPNHLKLILHRHTNTN